MNDDGEPFLQLDVFYVSWAVVLQTTCSILSTETAENGQVSPTFGRPVLKALSLDPTGESAPLQTHRYRLALRARHAP